jgi:hypothetical protein
MKTTIESNEKKKQYFTISGLRGLNNNLDKFISNFENLLSGFFTLEKSKNILEDTPLYFIHTEMIDELHQRQIKLEQENTYLKDKIRELEQFIVFKKDYEYINLKEDDENDWKDWNTITDRPIFKRKLNDSDYFNPPIITYNDGVTNIITSRDSGTTMTTPTPPFS